MEYQNIMSLLDAISDDVSIFINKKWIEVQDQSGNAENRYKLSKQIRFKTSMLQSDLCHYNDAYTVVKRTITVTIINNNAHNKKLAFKNNAPFISWISEINDTLTDNAEDLGIVMSTYHLIDYSKSYSRTSGCLWNCFKDETNTGAEGNIIYFIKDSKSFDYETSITGALQAKNTGK